MKKSDQLIAIYKCLCDQTRLRMLHLLRQGPLCVCHFQSILHLPQVAISKHLAYLKRNGLVTAKRHQQWMVYQLPAAMPRELHAQLACLQDCVSDNPIFQKDLTQLRATSVEICLPKTETRSSKACCNS